MSLKRIATFKDYLGELTVTYKRTQLESTKIRDSKDVVDYIRPYYEEIIDNHEEVKIMHLNRANKVVNIDHHSKGGVFGSVIDIKLIMQKALLIKTESIILIHNHPSGSLLPSINDEKITKKLKEATEVLDLKLLDSLIITRESYFSFGDKGML